MENNKLLISIDDAKILAQKIILNTGLSSSYNQVDVTVEMHIYDLSDNKILSIHAIPSGSWELYDKDEELLTQQSEGII